MPEFDVVDLGPTDHVTVGETAPDFRRPLVTDEFWEDRSLSALAADGSVLLVFGSMVGGFQPKYVLEELCDRGVGVSPDTEHEGVANGSPAGDGDEAAAESADVSDEAPSVDEDGAATDDATRAGTPATDDASTADEPATDDASAVDQTAPDSAALADVTVVGVTISTPYAVASFLDDTGLPYAMVSDPPNEVAEAYGVVHDLDGMAGIAEPRPAVFLVDSERSVEYAWVASEWPSVPPYDELETAIASNA